MSAVIDALRVWFRGVFQGKSVVVGSGDVFSRFQVGTLGDVLRLLEQSVAGRSNMYATLFADQSVVDTVVFDVDAHDGNVRSARDCFRRLTSVLRDYSYGDSIRQYFTGRGWHVYVDCHPVVLRSPSRSVSRLASAIAGRADCSHIDVSTSVRAVRGFMRVVGSFNPKSGSYMVETTEDEDLSSVVGRSASRDVSVGHSVRRSQVLSDDLVALDGEAPSGAHSPVQSDPSMFRAMPPCIQSYMDALVATGELNHGQRLQLAIWLIKTVGVSGAEQFFKEFARDYVPAVTSYQVAYLSGRGYKFMSCRRIKVELGGCPFADQENCIFYPWIELAFGGGGSGGEEQGSV